MTAADADSNGPMAIAVTLASTTIATTGPEASTTTASAAWDAAASRSLATITRTRSKRSASTPAYGLVRMAGTSRTTVVAPTQASDSVRS